jgi:hypothetical protein
MSARTIHCILFCVLVVFARVVAADDESPRGDGRRILDALKARADLDGAIRALEQEFGPKLQGGPDVGEAWDEFLVQRSGVISKHGASGWDDSDRIALEWSRDLAEGAREGGKPHWLGDLSRAFPPGEEPFPRGDEDLAQALADFDWWKKHKVKVEFESACPCYNTVTLTDGTGTLDCAEAAESDPSNPYCESVSITEDRVSFDVGLAPSTFGDFVGGATARMSFTFVPSQTGTYCIEPRVSVDFLRVFYISVPADLYADDLLTLELSVDQGDEVVIGSTTVSSSDEWLIGPDDVPADLTQIRFDGADLAGKANLTAGEEVRIDVELRVDMALVVMQRGSLPASLHNVELHGADAAGLFVPEVHVSKRRCTKTFTSDLIGFERE